MLSGCVKKVTLILPIQNRGKEMLATPSGHNAAATTARAQRRWLKYDDVMGTHVQGFHRTDLAAWMLRTLPKWAGTPMQHSALIFELLAPLLFTIPKCRWPTILYGLGFHLTIALLMSGLIFFSTQMWAFYAIFVTAAELRLLWSWTQLASARVPKLKPRGAIGA
jgi:hypothetical protein